MSPQVRLFKAPLFDPQKETVRIIRTYGASPESDLLYKKLPADYRFTSFGYTDNIEGADFVLIPQLIKRLTPRWLEYFERVEENALRYKKKIILFIGSDLAYRVHIDNRNVIAFKGSVYKHGKTQNEVMFAPFVGDLPEAARRFKREKPRVGFCGYAGFPDWTTRAKYMLKNMAFDIAAAITRNYTWRAHKRGIYFRRSAMHILERSPRIETNFILRSSFFGNSMLAGRSPEQTRAEYIANMQDSDFVLAPKGDGNYSSRFYEALSLGRIPILIDTDMVLPLENTVDYSKFVLRVPHTEVHRLADIVADFYDSLTDEEFGAMQQRAREVFRKYLRYDSYFNTALPLLKQEGVGALQ